MFLARDYKRQRALVRKSIPIFLRSAPVLPLAIHTLMAFRCLRLLDSEFVLRRYAADRDAPALVPQQGQSTLLPRLLKDVWRT